MTDHLDADFCIRSNGKSDFSGAQDRKLRGEATARYRKKTFEL